MSSAQQNFRAYGDDGTLVAVGGASAAVALPSDAYSASAPAIAIYNRGAAAAHVKVGNASVVATSLSVLVPAGTIATFERGAGNTHLAAICPGSTTELVVWLGDGEIDA